MSSFNRTNAQIVYKPKKTHNESHSHSSSKKNQNMPVFLPKNVGGQQQYGDISRPMKLNPWNYPEVERKDDEIPLPQGESAYAKAKRAEYIERNLPKAEKYYRLAIKNKERLESSIKDLATVLHQQGKTDEAVAILESNRHICFKHSDRLDNLLSNLKKQILPSGNFYNRTLVLFNVPMDHDETKIKSLFKNSHRIIQLDFKQDAESDKLLDLFQPENDAPLEKPLITIRRSCLVGFSSNSAARKTLETLTEQEKYQFYWMNTDKKIVSIAIPFKKKSKDDQDEDGNEVNSNENRDSHVQEDTVERTNSHRALTASVDVTTDDSMMSEFRGGVWGTFVFPFLPQDVKEDSVCDSSDLGNFFEEYVLEERWNDYKAPALCSWKTIEEKYSEARSVIGGDNGNFIAHMIRDFRRKTIF